MSTVCLIRHGQASFGAADYDRLSVLGREQSRLIGLHLASEGARVDAIYSGPAQRHRDTAETLRREAQRNGLRMPEIREVPELGELPAFELYRQALPQLATQSELEHLIGPAELGDPSALAALLRIMCRHWANGTLDIGPLETFAGFRSRVEAGLARIREEQGKGRSILVATSGGPIGVAVGSALGLDGTGVMDCFWALYNASLSDFLYSPTGFGLSSFNRRPHLREQRLLTHL